MAGLTDITGHDLDELRRRWWNDEGERAAEAGAVRVGRGVPRRLHARAWASTSPGRLGAHTGDRDDAVARRLRRRRRAAELGQVTLLTNNGPLSGAHLHEIAPELVDIFGEAPVHVQLTTARANPIPSCSSGCSNGTDARRRRLLRRRPRRERRRCGIRRHHRAPVRGSGGDACRDRAVRARHARRKWLRPSGVFVQQEKARRHAALTCRYCGVFAKTPAERALGDSR